MLSRRKALSMATVLLPQLYFTGTVAAQTPAPTTPPTETAQPAAESDVPRRKKAAEEEIVVTGSRVRRKDLTTPAPITVVSKEQLQASGKVSIGDFLQTLPEQGNAVNTSVNNGSTGDGSTRVNLRGLGVERTLVLMNGRRFVQGGPGANATVDLSSIPSAAIERIEVLKDGASAVYGSDAIGGVINLITRKKMNGVEVTGYSGTSTHSDGTIYDLNATAGSSGDRGSLLFSGGYYTQNPVQAGDREFSRVPLAYSSSGIGILGGQPGVYTQGSGTGPAGTFVLAPCRPTTPATTPCQGRTFPTATPLYNSLMTQFPEAGSFVRTTDADTRSHVCDSGGNCWRPFTTSQLADSANPLNGGDGYNFQPENYLVTPQQRISLFSTGETKLGGSARAYFEGSYVNRQGAQKLAPEPFLSDGEGITISKDNIYNPFGVNLAGVRRRLLEFNNRRFNQDIDTFRIVGGVDGTLPEDAGVLKGWYWDLSFNFGRTVASNTKRGNLFLPNVQDAVGPSFVDANGVARCGTAARPIADCVPLDLFHGGNPATITPDQITNLTFTGNQRGINQMVAGQANISGELFKLASERPVGLAAGYEYRILAGENIPDPITVAGLTTGNKGLITSGHYYVNEGYGELSIPLVSGLPFLENLEASAAARVFNYSNFGSDYTYKFGGRWTIVPDFTLRGTYSIGFRAPSIGDLFLGFSDNFPSSSDPCRGPGIAGGGPVPQNCLNQGIGAAGTGDTQTQLRSKVGGNPALQPEKAKIYTAGVVFEPRAMRGFTATVDYYHISVNKAITPIGAQLILNQCYPTDPATAPRYCDLVQRDPNTQRVTNIIDINQNVGQDETAGIDLALNYLVPTEAAGRFNLIFDGTWLQKFDRTLVDGSVIHGKNTFDLATVGGVYPAFKFISGVRWALSGFSAGVSTRFLSSYHECGSRSGNFNGTATCYDRTQPGDVGVTYDGPVPTARTVSAYNTWDLFASYAFATTAGKTTIGAGVSNVFNAAPAKIYNGFLAASDPTAYDFLGRFFYARVGQAF